MSSQIWNIVLLGGVAVGAYFVYINWATIFPEAQELFTNITTSVTGALGDLKIPAKTPTNLGNGGKYSSGNVVLSSQIPKASGAIGSPAYIAANKPATGNIGAVGTVYAKTPTNTGGAKPQYTCTSFCCSTAVATAACKHCQGKGKCPKGSYAYGKYAGFTQRVAYLADTYKSIYPRMSLIP